MQCIDTIFIGLPVRNNSSDAARLKMDTLGNFPFQADLTIFSFAIHRDFIIMTS